ncbi:unnamed protein product [Coregonus sp. 'balchen']|nr:unnamed protein product [Coregonus sp. 'balchen']
MATKKRCIYDITNVLEGVQLIRKKAKNNIQWMVGGVFEGSASGGEKSCALRKELGELERAEKALEDLITSSSTQLNELTEHRENQQLGYVTYQDIRSIASLQDQTVIAVKIYLKSKNGPIEVYLCPEEGLEDASPVKSTTTPRKYYPHHPLGHTATPSPVMAPPQYTTIKQGPQYTNVKQEPMEAELSRPAPVSLPNTSTTNTTTLLDVEGLLALPPMLQMTEDQLPGPGFTPDSNAPFISFSPHLDNDDYLWGLEDG